MPLLRQSRIETCALLPCLKRQLQIKTAKLYAEIIRFSYPKHTLHRPLSFLRTWFVWFAPPRREIKKMQKRRKSSHRRTIVLQRRFSAVEKAKTYNFMQESDRISTPLSAIWDTLKLNYNSLFSLFRSVLF